MSMSLSRTTTVGGFELLCSTYTSTASRGARFASVSFRRRTGYVELGE